MSPIYIWKDVQDYIPNENTVVYYPLDAENAVNDLSGHNYNLTQADSSTTVFGNYQGVDCCHFYSLGGSSGSCGLYRTSDTILSSGNNYTFNVWLYKGDESMSYNPRIVGMYGSPIFTYAGSSRISVRDSTSNGVTPSNGERFLFTCVCTGGSSWTYYKNGVYVDTQSASLSGWGNGIVLGTRDNLGTGYGDKWSGAMSRVIIENRLWNATDILDYYNLTKGFYGIN